MGSPFFKSLRANFSCDYWRPPLSPCASFSLTVSPNYVDSLSVAPLIVIFLQSCGYGSRVRLDLIFLKPYSSAQEPDLISPSFKELRSLTCSPNCFSKPISPSFLANPLSLEVCCHPPLTFFNTVPFPWLKSYSSDFPSCIKFIFIQEQEEFLFIALHRWVSCALPFSALYALGGARAVFSQGCTASPEDPTWSGFLVPVGLQVDFILEQENCLEIDKTNIFHWMKENPKERQQIVFWRRVLRKGFHNWEFGIE